MFGLTIPFAIEATRRNPVRQSVRNLAMSQGDDLTLAITVYASDGAPVDITYSAVTVAVQREAWECSSGIHGDYGLGWLTLAEPVVWAGRGAVTDGRTGRALVTIPQAVTSNWWGRFRIEIALQDPDAGCISARGVLDVRRCAPRLVPVFVPKEDFAASDFASGDFFTGSAASGGPDTGPTLGGFSLTDDFSHAFVDDYGRHLVAG